ncbi:MAG: class I SAM-dependent methyltransferase [Pseudomonadota bacterium]
MAAAPPTGAAFADAETASFYVHRPPYAAEASRRLLDRAPARDRLLDLGAGEGKIARQFAPHFGEVIAVDPSPAMITLGRSLPCGRARTLTWVCATAEEAALTGTFDVVSFASSIHWMDLERLFSALAPHLAQDHVIAVLEGDTPHAPPWAEAYQVFLARWVPRVTGRPHGSEEWTASRERHLTYLDVISTEALLSDPIRQSAVDFVACQHSRASFTARKLATCRADFDQELLDLLAPHSAGDSQLTYRVQTKLTLARLRGGPCGVS